jgi:hypothetical protein
LHRFVIVGTQPRVTLQDRHLGQLIGCAVQAPATHRSPLVQALPSSQGASSGSAAPAHWPALHVSPLVQGLSSLQSPLDGRCWHSPAALHTSVVQGLSSLVHPAPSAACQQVEEQQSPSTRLPSSQLSPASI